MGEMLVDSETMQLTALYNGDPSKIAVLPGNSPELPVYLSLIHILDAIHDTVHEMAKDEARHGCAFEGLLNRYFK